MQLCFWFGEQIETIRRRITRRTWTRTHAVQLVLPFDEPRKPTAQDWQFAQRHETVIRKVVSSWCRSPDDIEDMVQHVTIHLAQRVHRFDGTNAEGWVATIAWREASKKLGRSKATCELLEADATRDDTAHEIEADEALREIWKSNPVLTDRLLMAKTERARAAIVRENYSEVRAILDAIR